MEFVGWRTRWSTGMNIFHHTSRIICVLVYEKNIHCCEDGSHARKSPHISAEDRRPLFVSTAKCPSAFILNGFAFWSDHLCFVLEYHDWPKLAIHSSSGLVTVPCVPRLLFYMAGLCRTVYNVYDFVHFDLTCVASFLTSTVVKRVKLWSVVADLHVCISARYLLIAIGLFEKYY